MERGAPGGCVGTLIAKIGKIEQSYGPVALAIVDLALKGKKEEAIRFMGETRRMTRPAAMRKVAAVAAELGIR